MDLCVRKILGLGWGEVCAARWGRSTGSGRRNPQGRRAGTCEEARIMVLARQVVED